jgi:hypothetical protein
MRDSCGNFVTEGRFYDLRFVMLENAGCVFAQIKYKGQTQSHWFFLNSESNRRYEQCLLCVLRELFW